jgi:hypothetical protein
VDKAAAVLRECLRLNPDFPEAFALLKKLVKPVTTSLASAKDKKEKQQWAAAEEE